MPLGRGPHLLEFCHIKSQASKKELLWRHSPSIPGRTHQPTTHPPTTSRPSTHRPRASAVIWPHFPTESSRRPNRPANGGFHLRSDDETGIFGLDGWKVTRENPICYVYRSTITLLVFWKSTVLERNKKNRTGFQTPTEFGPKNAASHLSLACYVICWISLLITPGDFWISWFTTMPT